MRIEPGCLSWQALGKIPAAALPLRLPRAERLETNHSLAASHCWRAMVDFNLLKACCKRSSHAGGYLHTCHVLDRGIQDWGDLEHHSTHVARWRRDQGRKQGLWSLVPQEMVPEVVPEAKPTGTSKAAQGDGPGQAASPTASPAASPAASAGPLQPGLW